MFKMAHFPYYKICCEKKKHRLTKPCSTIKVTHILGFITVKTYANVAVTLWEYGKYETRLCPGTHSAPEDGYKLICGYLRSPEGIV